MEDLLRFVFFALASFSGKMIGKLDLVYLDYLVQTKTSWFSLVTLSGIKTSSDITLEGNMWVNCG